MATQQHTRQRGLAYCRYSPRPEQECDSLEVQEDFIRRYFDFVGIEVAKVICDPETSARKVPLHKRKGGAELLRLTTGNTARFSIVGAYRLDRLFRSVVDGCQVLNLWRREGVACHFAAEGGQSLNTATATGRFIVNVLLSKAEYEPDLTAERTSDAMQKHIASGRQIGRYPIYGKRTVIVDGRRMLEDDPAQQPTLAYILKLHAEGRSPAEIRNDLNSLGIPSGQGGKWTAKTVASVCRRAPVKI